MADKKTVSPWDTKVKIKLPRDTMNGQKCVFVAVNGHNFQIQRGVEVEVPEPIYEVLRNNERMEELVQEKLDKLTMADAGYHKLTNM